MQTKLNLVKGISQKELPDIMVASGEGIVALDKQGCVTSVDAGAVRMLGWQADEIIGREFFAFINFSLGDVAALGSGSSCPALNTIQCPHLNLRANLSRKGGRPIVVDFMMTTLLEAGRISGKLFVFSEHIPPIKPVAEQLVETAASLVVQLNAAGEVVFCNPHCQWLLGEENADTLIPASIRTLLAQHPHQLDQQTLLDKRCLAGQEKELCIVWSVSVTRNGTGEVTGAVCIGNDFTDHNHSLKGQLHESQTVQKIFESLNDGVITVDLDGRVIYLNRVAEQLTGWSRREAQGRSLRDVYHVVDELSLEGGDDLVGLCLDSGNSVNSDGNRVLLRRGGWEFIVQDTATPVHDINDEITGAVLVFTDISELRGMERWMEYESSHDALTGLINRQEFEDLLQIALDSVQKSNQHHVLCYLDLDQFRLINDTYGHAAGDQLLKEISLLLKECLGDDDSLARLGGDEFGVILKNQDMNVARRAAKSMCRAVRDFYFVWDDKPFEVSVSIGLVPITPQWMDRAEILRVADSACDVAKEMGRNRVHAYEPRDLALRQREVEMRWIYLIRQALNEDRFQLYYQNIVPLSKKPGQDTHYEILLRMVAEDGNIIGPSEFIAAAERYHLMPAVDRWVVNKALKLLRQRRINGEVSGMFAINLSGQSLDDEAFLDFVVDKLRETETPPKMVCFEITETVAATHLDVVQKFMSVLREMGCRFALDDFGRGISSFAYLKNLRVDYLKIDGMFVQKIAEDEIDHAMVESINHIGHIMGMQTIAEFVESQEVLEKLIDLGVDHVQGYQFGRPQPLRSAYQPVEVIN
ncbi:MAG: EAL domain-containing protein [Ectothiorhodospiraceae bacterium]|nr:EAL domain-containing protein [Ectothiorhodospiraceae bacterium]